MTEAYREANSRKLIIILFFVSTFMIQIVFLNILIAIMGDAYDEAMLNKENNTKNGMLNIMLDYIQVIREFGDGERKEEYIQNYE